MRSKLLMDPVEFGSENDKTVGVEAQGDAEVEVGDSGEDEQDFGKWRVDWSYSADPLGPAEAGDDAYHLAQLKKKVHMNDCSTENSCRV